MQTQLFIWRRHCVALASVMLTCNIAIAQNWVSSGPPGAPVIPFDALVTGSGAPYNPSSGPPTVPLYTCRGGTAEGYGLQVGRFTPGSTGCDFGYGGKEISVPDFQFLVTSWQPASGGFVPPNAVAGGWDTPPPGSSVKPSLYFCRATIGTKSLSGSTVSLVPGKIRPGFAGCTVPYSGREYSIGTYEVLVAENPAMPWYEAGGNVGGYINGFVPQDAIRAGTDVDGTPLYLCAAYYLDSTQLGKLRSSFKGCNISYGGVEYTVPNYFVPVTDWLGANKFDFPAGVDSDGSPLHICRALQNGGIEYPGKMRATWTTCSYGLGGKEQAGSHYEVLSH